MSVSIVRNKCQYSQKWVSVVNYLWADILGRQMMPKVCSLCAWVYSLRYTNMHVHTHKHTHTHRDIYLPTCICNIHSHSQVHSSLCTVSYSTMRTECVNYYRWTQGFCTKGIRKWRGRGGEGRGVQLLHLPLPDSLTAHLKGRREKRGGEEYLWVFVIVCESVSLTVVRDKLGSSPPPLPPVKWKTWSP